MLLSVLGFWDGLKINLNPAERWRKHYRCARGLVVHARRGGPVTPVVACGNPNHAHAVHPPAPTWSTRRWKLAKPVKLAWTREDEIRHGFYRAQNFQSIRATLARDGSVTGWLHRTVFPTIDWGFDPENNPSDGELSQGFTNMPYRIPNVRLEAGGIGSSQRIGWWRSVCNTFHAFAVNSFIDELAHAVNRDPLAFHLKLLGDPRILEFSDRDRQNPYKFDTGG